MVLTIWPSSDSARRVRSAVAAATTAASPAGLPSGSGGAAASGAQASKAPPAANSNLLDMVLLLSGTGRGEAEKTIGRGAGRLDSAHPEGHSPRLQGTRSESLYSLP